MMKLRVFYNMEGWGDKENRGTIHSRKARHLRPMEDMQHPSSKPPNRVIDMTHSGQLLPQDLLTT